MVLGHSNDVPVARLIGFEAKEIADGRAVVSLAAGQQHANPMGTLHGGILCDIADASMGMASASTLVPVESVLPRRTALPSACSRASHTGRN